MKRFLVWLNVAVAVTAIGYGTWWLNTTAEVQAQTAVQAVADQAQQKLDTNQPQAALQGNPVRLVIPSLAIDLPVGPGRFDASQHTWVTDKTIVDFIPATAPLTNTQGSMFLYGHNAGNVLGKTKNLHAGDVAYIYTDNGHVFSYTYTSDIVVKPTNVDVLNGLNMGAPGFKLMTCVGWMDQDRRIMTFTLTKAV